MIAEPAVPVAFSRVVIDVQLKDAWWMLTDGRLGRFEVTLSDGAKADYVVADRNGRPLAVLEAGRMAIAPLGAEKQAWGYATQLGVPCVCFAVAAQHTEAIGCNLDAAAIEVEAMAAALSAEVFEIKSAAALCHAA